MLPTNSFASIISYWNRISFQRFTLYGFLLYTKMDTSVVDYLQGRDTSMLGIDEMDSKLMRLKGRPCAIFLIESLAEPWLKQWLLQGNTRKHMWWEIFGPLDSTLFAIDPPALTELRAAISTGPLAVWLRENLPMQIESGQVMGITELPAILASRSARELADEVGDIADWFNIKDDRMPCIAFFYPNLQGIDVGVATMNNVKSQQEVVSYMRRLFSSQEFEEAIEKSQRTVKSLLRT